MAQQKLFTLLSPVETGIQFTNQLVETDKLHIMNYEYLYNGNGIAIGDFNNDGLDDIFFTGNTVKNKLYMNKGNFKFDDITVKAGVEGNNTWSTGAVAADVNGDGLMDIYVCHSGKFAEPSKLSNELYINKGVINGVPKFVNEADTYGLALPGTQSTMAVFFDYDLDGDLDMFLVNHALHNYDPFENTSAMRKIPSPQFGNRLFKNMLIENGKNEFKDVTAQAGIINNALNYGLSVSISDLNMDGWPDIYTTSDYTEKDCFYINNKNGTFTESLQKSFTQISKYAMGSDIADCNNDGLPDVFTLDMLPEDNYRQKLLKGPDEYDKYQLIVDSGFYHQQMRNMLQLNEGLDAADVPRFSEVAQLSGISNTDWSWSALWFDADNDGRKDLFVSNGYLRDFTNMDFLKYTVADYQLAKASQGKLNYKTYDLVKQMPQNKLANYLFKNNDDLQFTNKAADWGISEKEVSNTSAYSDLDNDGDLDLVISNLNAPVSVYRNNSDVSKNNYLNIILKGDKKNTQAIGATAKIYTQAGEQVLEHFTVRGYQSTVTSKLHFGLGEHARIDSLKITWPGNKTFLLKDIKAGSLLTIDEQASTSTPEVQNHSPKYFRDITAASGINFQHKENDFIDFKYEVLVPWELSKYGPALAKADVNNDGLDDFFVGGAIGQGGVLYVQDIHQKFFPVSQNCFNQDASSEDVNALFFDADKDGDMDLYVVSGGDEYEVNAPEYQDRLYINDGKGNFTKNFNALPVMYDPKLAISAADYDGDGDLDLFIGGKAIPGSFPLPSRSYVLRNDSHTGTIQFTDVTATLNPLLVNPGLVSTATWFKERGETNLLIAGDFMPLRCFLFKDGKLSEQTKKAFSNSEGFWASLLIKDVNGDGLQDIIAGNCGNNLQYKASVKKPVELYYGDLDNNGTIDPVMCYYIGDSSYPAASRDELLEQVNAYKKKYVYYKDYATATMAQIVLPQRISDIPVLKAYDQQSHVFINDGKGDFIKTDLPVEADFSRVSSITSLDSTSSSKIILAGNFYPYRTQMGRCDASLGLVIRYDKNKFVAEQPYQSGLYLTGDVRQAVVLKSVNQQQLLLVAANNGPLQLLQQP